MDNGKRKKRIIIVTVSALAAVLAITGFIVFLVLVNKVKINLNDYLTISYSGYDSMGEADYKINYKKLIEDYAEKLDLNNQNAKIAFEFALEECVTLELSKEEQLSNGDSISLKWKVDNRLFKDKYGCTLEYKSTTEKVSGLQEMTEYDPFEKLGISYEGMAPHGKVKINKSDIEYYWLKYTVTPSEGLTNGDKVKVTIEYNDEVQQHCKKEGIKIVSTEKEYNVEGLSKYVDDFSEIPDEQLSKMKNQAEDTLKSYVAANWVETESLKAANFLGCYLLSAKGDVGYGEAKNYLYLIYQIDVSNSEGEFSYYYYTRFDSMYITGEGDFVVDLLKYSVPKGGGSYHLYGEAFKHGKYYYLGYENLDLLFNACVTTKLEKYTYISNVN